MANLNTEIKTVIGNLLLRADELSKRVLTAYDPLAKKAANLKALNGFNLDMLEPCCTLLGIELADPEGNKIYTKESLVNRLMLGINALLPSQCSECSEHYTFEFDSDSQPLFTCHMCFQVSHDCSAIKEKHQVLSEASIALLSGHVWLCGNCLKSSNPVKLRKSKSRHNSITTTDAALSRIRDELQSQQPGTSSPNVMSPLHLNNDTSDSHLPQNEQQTPLEPEHLRRRLLSISHEQVCSKYKLGKCPHGLRGNKLVNGKTCDFEHPKRCFKFCSFGTTKNGCKSGANCAYYHPTLCKHSLNRRVCTNKECTFVHLKGTKRVEPSTDNVSSNVLSNVKPSKMTTSVQNPSEDHFLELKRLVSEMQSNFSQEISSIKASLLQVQIHAPINSLYHPHHPPLMNPIPAPQYHQAPPPVQGMTYIPHSSF